MSIISTDEYFYAPAYYCKEYNYACKYKMPASTYNNRPNNYSVVVTGSQEQDREHLKIIYLYL